MKVYEILQVGDKVLQPLIEIIRTHFKNNFLDVVNERVEPIYRGDDRPQYSLNDEIGYLYSTARTQKRGSATMNNIALDFVSQSPEWKGIPDRALSISCSPRTNYAVQFGNANLVIPADNVKTFAVMNEDFNHFHSRNFKTFLFNARILYKRIITLAAEIRDECEKDKEWITKHPHLKPFLDPIFDIKVHASEARFSLKDIEKISALLDAVHKFSKEERDFDGDTYFTNEFGKMHENLDDLYEDTGGKTLLQHLQNEYTPSNMGVRLVKFHDLVDLEPESEVWFIGDYLFLRVPSHGMGIPHYFYNSKLLKSIAEQL